MSKDEDTIRYTWEKCAMRSSKGFTMFYPVPLYIPLLLDRRHTSLRGSKLLARLRELGRLHKKEKTQ